MTPAEIADQLRLFVAADQVTELRALHVGQRGRMFAGWFTGDRLTDLARNALALTRQAAGCYFVPNPVAPELAVKRLNKILDVHKGFALTHDADVIERRFLIVDLDPRRMYRESTYTYEGDQDAPTSARELALALHVARREVIPYTRTVGAPDPIQMCSGNGIHLVYAVNPPLPAPPTGKCPPDDPLASLLRVIATRSSFSLLAVDPATYTPARMLKVPGTLSRKGTATPTRPHRQVRILSVPNDWRNPVPTGRPVVLPAAAAGVDLEGDRGQPGGRPTATPAADRPAAVERQMFDPGHRGRGTTVH